MPILVVEPVVHEGGGSLNRLMWCPKGDSVTPSTSTWDGTKTWTIGTCNTWLHTIIHYS